MITLFLSKALKPLVSYNKKLHEILLFIENDKQVKIKSW